MKTAALTLFFAYVAFAAAGPCTAQDPVKAAPGSYKLQLENDLIKVLRVHYPARAKVPVHDHSRSPAAYVYLNDSGPITFQHPGWDHPVLRRPAVKAGSFRLSPTRFSDETHEVDNPNDTPSDFLRIEFKFLPVAKTSVVGRFARGEIAVNKPYSKVDFDNENVRVTRQIVTPGQEARLTAKRSEPALIVIVFANSDKGQKRGEFEQGQTIWIPAGEEKLMLNASGSFIEFLRIDLKPASGTKPSK